MSFTEQLTERMVATEALVGMLADGMLADQMGSNFTCAEVETLATFLRAWDADAYATIWLDMHARNDDEGDDHFERGIEVNKQIENEGYSILEEARP